MSELQFQELQFQECLSVIRANSTDSCLLHQGELSERKVILLAQALESNCSIRKLDLVDCGMGPAGAVAFSRFLATCVVRELDLRGNEIQDRGAKALAAALRASPLTRLWLPRNKIGVEGAKSLAAALRESKLTLLDLASNSLDDESVKALATGLKDSLLETLGLSKNTGIATEGFEALAAALQHSNIQVLYLQRMRVRDVGGLALLEGARDTALTELWMSNSGCSERVLQQIKDTLAANKARSFLLQMQVEGDEANWTFTFRTAAGTIAAVLSWSCDRPVQELREAVFSAIRGSGNSSFQLPDRHLRAHNLRIVRQDGQLLEDGPNAPDLAEQVRDPKRRRLH